jgi:hypothetical protein
MSSPASGTTTALPLEQRAELVGEWWLPDDPERWRAELLDDGPEDRLGFWCAGHWEREFA